MPLPLEIILRFSLGSGQRRFTRFVAMASLIGMMLGVAALIMVLSVMNGFSGELHQRLLSVTPDLVLEPSTPTADGLSELARRASERPSVQWRPPRFSVRRHCCKQGSALVAPHSLERPRTASPAWSILAASGFGRARCPSKRAFLRDFGC